MQDFIPVIYPTDGTHYRATDAEETLLNCIPWMLQNGQIGACPRHEFSNSIDDPTSSADRGRGIVTFDNIPNIRCDESSYYYDGGSQDLEATSSPGYAGNTGIASEYLASFIEHRISNVPNLVIVSAGNTATSAGAKHGNIWYASSGGAAPASVDDPNMPGNNGISLARGGVSLDGYFFAMDINSQIHNSNLNDITTWTALDFITAERESDIGVFLGRQGDDLAAIGSKSIEYFYNAGNASGSPLARRQGIFHSVGSLWPNAICQVGQVIYFVGVEPGSGWCAVYRMENLQIVKISTRDIEKRIPSAPYFDLSDEDTTNHQLWLCPCTLGDSFGLLLTKDNEFTYYWHAESGKWTRWEYGSTVTHVGGTSGNWNDVLPIVAYNGTTETEGGSPDSLYQLTNGRVVYEGSTDNDALDDWESTNSPNVYMQFPRWDAGTDQKKIINWAMVITAPVATDASTHETMDVTLRWFDYGATTSGGPVPPDDYQAGRSINLNTRGSRITRCGSTFERSWLLDWGTGHGPVTVVKGLLIDYDVVS